MFGSIPVGSAVDVATLIIVTVELGLRLRPRVEATAAGLVAVARREPHVDADQLQSELDVADRDVEAVEQRVVPARGDDAHD
jgi:hypothetical protein